MLPNDNRIRGWTLQGIYFVVLAGSFYLSGLLLAIQGQGNLLLQSLLYATVAIVSIRLGRYLIWLLVKSTTRIIYTVLTNAAGLTLGVVLLSILSIVFPELAGPIIAIIVSSVIAFFVLGTFSPMLLIDRRMKAR